MWCIYQIKNGKQVILKALFEENNRELRKRIRKNVICVAMEKFAFSSLLDVQDEQHADFNTFWDDMLKLLFKNNNDMCNKFKKVLNEDKREHKRNLNKIKSLYFEAIDEKAEEKDYKSKWNTDYKGYVFYTFCVYL